MGKLIIVNGSPRAPRSNSRKYTECFKLYWQGETEEYFVTVKKYAEAIEKIRTAGRVLLVFPLYADGIPVTLMEFLKELERVAQGTSVTVHIIINCGFFEPKQNEVALDILKEYCRRCGFNVGSVLSIGSGEAFPTTPLMFFVKRKLKKLARAISLGKNRVFKVTLPLTKRMFLRASTTYWTNYGKKNNITSEQMNTMKIEGE